MRAVRRPRWAFFGEDRPPLKLGRPAAHASSTRVSLSRFAARAAITPLGRSWEEIAAPRPDLRADRQSGGGRADLTVRTAPSVSIRGHEQANHRLLSPIQANSSAESLYEFFARRAEALPIEGTGGGLHPESRRVAP